MSKTLRAEFESIWDTLSMDRTLAAAPINATLRGIFQEEALELGLDPASLTVNLPRITLDGTDDDSGVDGARGDVADLRLDSPIGSGGMGLVFAATQRSLGRSVAVKILRDTGSHAMAATSLLHEARITGGLEHPNIVPVHALGIDGDNRPVLVMKRVEGTTWATLLHDPSHPAWASVKQRHEDPLLCHVEVLVQLCNALQFAHTQGILHRDIKPENVMIGAFGEVYLLDWGVASRMTKRPTTLDPSQRPIVGTPMYMAPELVEGDPAEQDERTDVYLLGATLHEVLTGVARHGGKTLASVLLQAYLSEPWRYGPEVSSELAALCNESTSRDKTQRPTSVAVFRQRLLDFLRHRASSALSDTALARLARVESEFATHGSDASVEAWGLLTEARFGFAQALREWSANTRATEGLQRALEQMIRREVALRDVGSAQRLLLELPQPNEALAAEVAALGTEIEALHARDKRLQRLRQEMDPTVSAWARAMAFAVILALSLAVTGLLLHSAGSVSRIEPRAMAAVDVFGLAVVLILAWILRRQLFANVISRRLSWGVGAQCLGLTLTSVMGWWMGQTTVQILVSRMMLLAATFAVAAVVSIPVLRWLALVSVLSAIVTALWPAAVGIVMPASILLVLALAVRLSATGALRPREFDVADPKKPAT
ncbi:MAG: serine/threonine-protein kinase [Deltaproteobacteria bacterium]|nr:serine/threonine-protein kinase [Deltaproteobacteria bacterium]